MKKNNPISITIIALVISFISLIISIIIGIIQLNTYAYSVKTNFSVRVKLLKHDMLERKIVNVPDFNLFVTIGIPVEIFVTNLCKKNINIWKVITEKFNDNFKVIESTSKMKLFKKLTYAYDKQYYINAYDNGILIEQEKCIKFYGIIELNYNGETAKKINDIMKKINKKNISMNDILIYNNDKEFIFFVKNDKFFEKIINNKIIIRFITADYIEKNVIIDKFYKIYDNTIILINFDEYFTDSGSENTFGGIELIEK